MAAPSASEILKLPGLYYQSDDVTFFLKLLANGWAHRQGRQVNASSVAHGLFCRTTLTSQYITLTQRNAQRERCHFIFTHTQVPLDSNGAMSHESSRYKFSCCPFPAIPRGSFSTSVAPLILSVR